MSVLAVVAVLLLNQAPVEKSWGRAAAAKAKRAKANPLETARAEGLAKLGTVTDQVLTRLPIPTPGPPWPALAIAKLKIVRREKSVLVVTDGLSDDWDRTLHDDAPDWTFDFEVGVEVPLDQLEDSSDQGIAKSWVPQVLWSLTDAIVPDRIDVKGRLGKFDSLTFELDPIEGLEALQTKRKTLGVLIGVPLIGDAVGSEAILVPRDEANTIWLITAKVLTPDEFDYALSVKGGERGVELGNAFIARGDRHQTWPNRRSILPTLKNKRRKSP